MADFLIDISSEEPLSSAPSTKYSSLLDRISEVRKLEDECYKALEVRTASRMLSRSFRSSLTASQELIEENEKLAAENKTLKSQLTNTSESTSTLLPQQPQASFQKLQIEHLEHQLKEANLSMVGHPATCVY